MTQRNLALFLLLAAAAIAGSGCSRTLVAALPVGTTTTCDPAWPGRWQANPTEDRKDKHGEKVWLEINADCSELTSIDEHGKRERENHKLTLITTRTGDYLWIADSVDKSECLGESTEHCGMELMRYVRDGNAIRLYYTDHDAVHAAIAAGRILGYSDVPANGQEATASAADSQPKSAQAASLAKPSTDQSHSSNWIAGNSEQITTILEEHPEFFESEPWLTLQRDTRPNRAKHR